MSDSNPTFKINVRVEIRPLEALYPPPKKNSQKVLYRALSSRQGWYAHAYGICAPFYYISLKKDIFGVGFSATVQF